jgi:hypothetical protein
MINYTVKTLGDIPSVNDPYMVDRPTSLFKIVNELKEAGYTTIHFACCGASYTLKDKYREMMPYFGYYTRLR